MTRTKIVVLGAFLLVVGCSRDRERTGTTTTTGAQGTSTSMRQGAMTKTKNTDAVRARMAQDQPQAVTTIDELMITDDGTTVMISGVVEDEQTHQALLSSAKKTPGVNTVKDDIRVSGH